MKYSKIQRSRVFASVEITCFWSLHNCHLKSPYQVSFLVGRKSLFQYETLFYIFTKLKCLTEPQPTGLYENRGWATVFDIHFYDHKI